MSAVEPGAKPREWYTQDPESALLAFEVDATAGLDPSAVLSRLAEYGPNALATEPPPSLWAVALGQLSNPMNIMLVIVAVASIAIGQVAPASSLRCS